MIPTLALGLFTWVSFYYAGVRARRRDWIAAGAGYSVFSALAFFALSRPEVDSDETANTLLGGAVAVAWIGGVIHALVINPAFLRILAGGSTPPLRRARQVDRTGLGVGDPAADYLAKRPAEPQSAARLVEANTARPRTLARLPGVGDERARRWVAERERRGGFRDLDELAGCLQLQPHELVRLRPRLSFADPGPSPKRRPPTKRGRVLDV